MSPGKIVWRNERLLAVDKAANVLTVPGRQGERDGRPCLGRWLEAELGVRLWPVHRLDFEVAGLVVFACDAGAHRAASLAFEQRLVRKTYEGLTALPPAPPDPGSAWTWESQLVRGKRRSFAAPYGQWARTRAVFVRRLESAVGLPGLEGVAPPLGIWKLFPETGRPHQLRVHLAAAGFPLLGDPLYGGPPAPSREGIALRSVSLVFPGALSDELGVPSELQVPGLFG
ncbi:MAG: RNA pseudouridine synthase [Myxococcales bacterium]|nr:RNA pseudouridine synthase [Myxococcales bacterium]